MSAIETDEINEERYKEWVAGREERIAPRKARRLGEVATNNETHLPQNPQRLIDSALEVRHEEHIATATSRVKIAGNFLASLDELLAVS